VNSARNLLTAHVPPSRRLGSSGGFSLIETMIAIGLCAVTITSFYLMLGQAIIMTRSSRESVLSIEMLQQRVDSLGRSTFWNSLISSNGLTQALTPPAPLAANFLGVTEKCTVTPYPPTGSVLSVSRTPAGVLTTSGTSLASTERCIQVTMEATWMGANKRPVSRSLSTILTKGAL
jgi:hypothetical protein